MSDLPDARHATRASHPHDLPAPGFPRRVEVDGLTADDVGAGIPVLLLHAGIADGRMWERELADWPALGRRVLRFDQRGFGEAPYPARSFSRAADALAVLDAAGVDRAVLVACSMSGPTALEVAVAAPERVRALVLVAPADRDRPPTPELEAFGAAEDAALAAGDLDAAADVNVRFWLDRDGARAVPERVRAHVHAMQRRAFEHDVAAPAEADTEPLVPDLAARLADIPAPVLVIAGADDVPTFQEIAADLAGRLPRARLAVVDGAAHLPSLEQPAAFDALVDAFLAEHG